MAIVEPSGEKAASEAGKETRGRRLPLPSSLNSSAFGLSEPNSVLVTAKDVPSGEKEEGVYSTPSRHSARRCARPPFTFATQGVVSKENLVPGARD